MAGKWDVDTKKPSPALWDKLMDDIDQGKSLTNEEIVKFYDLWAESEELDKLWSANGVKRGGQLTGRGRVLQAVSESGYQALDVMQGILEDLYPAQDRHHVTILDVGACTGNSGQRLYEMGFRNTDALDPSSVSLEVAKRRGVYRAFYSVPMTAQPLSIPQDSYDAIVLLGVMGPAHIPVEAFKEMIRLVKPDGYIINLTRADFLERCQEYASQWKPAIEAHVTAGHWRLLNERRYDAHFGCRAGYLHVFQTC